MERLNPYMRYLLATRGADFASEVPEAEELELEVEVIDEEEDTLDFLDGVI